MANQVYVLRADLVGFRGIHRTIAVRSDQTLVDVHYALQAAFDWDDDHLYSYWLDGEFWSRGGREYTHPFHASQPNPLGPFARGPAPGSAEIHLSWLKLKKGQRSPTCSTSATSGGCVSACARSSPTTANRIRAASSRSGTRRPSTRTTRTSKKSHKRNARNAGGCAATPLR